MKEKSENLMLLDYLSGNTGIVPQNMKLFITTAAVGPFYMSLKGKSQAHIHQIKCTNMNAHRDNHKYKYLS